MNKKKKIALITAAITVWVIIIIAFVLARTGKLSFFSNRFDDVKETSVTTVTDLAEKDNRVKRKIPEKVFGMYLVAGVDFLVNPEFSVDEIKASIDEGLKYTTEKGFNTIYVSALAEKQPILIGTGKDEFDVLSYISEKAHENNLYVVATLSYNDAILVDSEIKSNDILIKKLAQSDADAILMTDITSFDTSIFTGDATAKTLAINDTIKNIEETAKSVNKVIEFGVEVSPVWAHIKHDETGSNTSSYYESYMDSQLDTKLWVKNGYVDFIYVDGDNSMARANANYKTCMEWWNSVVEGTNVALFAKHRVDLVCSDNTTWSNADELARQMMATTELKNCKGNGFYNLAAFKADKNSSIQRFTAYLNGQLDSKFVLTDLIITNQSKTKINTSESKISFTGTGDPSSPITLNGEELDRTDEGYFSLVLDLKAGNNVFTFANKGQTKVYSVNYTLDVIKSISPTGNAYGIGGTSIEIKAVAIEGSDVYATINGSKIPMSIGSAEVAEGDLANTYSFDYVTYVGTYKLPAGTTSVQNLGATKVFASFQGHSDYHKGANIYVNARTSQRLGVVSSKYAETYDAQTLDGKYNPTFTQLPKGTYDFIEAEATIDNQKYYKLSSGRLVSANDMTYSDNPAEQIVNGVQVTESVSTSKATQIKLKTDWWVPFNVQQNPQSYFKGYDSRVFNVASFTASYVDVIFYYTYSASGAVDVSGSNVVSSAEWVNVGQNGTSTLRLHLRKSGAFYGYDLSHDDSTGSFVLYIKNKPTALSGYTVLIDPGHGGSDPGALGAIIDSETGKQYYESKANLILSNLVKQKLVALGVNVVMTRTGDTTRALTDRANYITELKPDISLSIHNDSSTSSTSTGTSAYYFKPYSFPLAKEVHNNLLSAWNSIYGRPIQDRGINFYPFRIARVDVCPAILIECGFMSNPTEVTLLTTPANQEILSSAITNGIISYINNY
ncbi:MAG: N-acetylmuramoyl-L-alanine amidase [Clostridia bacterium]|nr:N-acetylmuramoyl-L-alanine amidase [Clostridia bacterium]